MPIETDPKLEARAATQMLVELDEPEAWLEALRRIADRRARELQHGLVSAELAAKRWRRLALAIERVQGELEREAHAPVRNEGEPDQAA